MEIFARSTFCARARSSSRSIGPSNPSSLSTRLSPGGSIGTGGGAAAVSDGSSIEPFDVLPGEPEDRPEGPREDTVQRLADRIEANQARQDEHSQQDQDDANPLELRPNPRERQRQHPDSNAPA